MKLHLLAVLAAALAGSALAQSPDAKPPAKPKIDPETVVLENGRERVIARDFDAAMTRFPVELREEARAYPSVVMKNLDAIFVNRVAAERARELGLGQDPLSQQRMKQLQ